MFRAIRVVGVGRLGGALAARLHASGTLATDAAPDLVVLCVPDAVIAEVARAQPVGPWVAHMSGATPLDALSPHTHRFGLHPLQTFVKSRGPEQFDGAWAAVTGDSDEARARARAFAGQLSLQPFDLAEPDRGLYHAGAAMASNHFVALYRAAARIMERVGVPSDALVPLMRRTLDNHFELTGPAARGDQATVAAHLSALHRELPDLEPLHRTLAGSLGPLPTKTP
jgi:predicted short-subunit dehydrogenase-like oxidoreductase (DUF2520 family)